jgi:hypothetical protein
MLAYMIRGWVVLQWPSVGCRAREDSSCSVQEAGSLRTRGTNDAAPVCWRLGRPLWRITGVSPCSKAEEAEVWCSQGLTAAQTAPVHEELSLWAIVNFPLLFFCVGCQLSDSVPPPFRAGLSYSVSSRHKCQSSLETPSEYPQVCFTSFSRCLSIQSSWYPRLAITTCSSACLVPRLQWYKDESYNKRFLHCMALLAPDSDMLA